MLGNPTLQRKPIEQGFDLAGFWWLNFDLKLVRWLSGLKQSFAKAP
jgi:hypothetical protein